MREIKSRAWHSEHGEWVYLSLRGVGTLYGSFNEYERWAEWTGLKDKNGKEIYEDDIVRMVGGASERGFRFEIYWADAASWRGWGLKGQGHLDKKQYYQTWSSKDAEVIGNIYENPDLLNAQSATVSH
jgi:hypothetical protein